MRINVKFECDFIEQRTSHVILNPILFTTDNNASINFVHISRSGEFYFVLRKNYYEKIDVDNGIKFLVIKFNRGTVPIRLLLFQL